MFAVTAFAVGCGSTAVRSTSSGTSPATSQGTTPSTRTGSTTGPSTGSTPRTTDSTPTTGPPTTDPNPTDPDTTDPDTTDPDTTDADTTETPDTTPPAIIDRFWRADSNITVGGLRALPTGTGAGFTITADGTITVNTGCNTGTGHVTFENGGQLVVSGLRVTQKACQTSAGDVETTILFILGERNSYSIDGDMLKLIPLGITDVGLTLVSAS